jgi:nucleoside-diphosphate-sugar epimerase
LAPKVLVTGSAGQIGSELTPLLRQRYGAERVVAGILKGQSADSLGPGPAVTVDVTDGGSLRSVIKEMGIDTVYHLAAVLSARGEEDPQLAWDVNVLGLKNVLDASRELGVSRVFWPSSIAVFGPDAPRRMTPQNPPLNPTTMYGVTKVAGELLCHYYSRRYSLDTRSVRYPGIVSSKTRPGGGTTDYAVEMFYAAVSKGEYRCFVREDTTLPMMYMPDALRAAVLIMEAEPQKVRIHRGYNVASMSFSAGELAAEIRKHLPHFSCSFVPDKRQEIADSWPESIDDSEARRDWGWFSSYDIHTMVEDMILKVSSRHLTAPDKG